MSKLKKALEKAKEARTETKDKVTTISIPEAEPSQVEEVNPEYKRTRIVPVDPAVLKSNKVVALFHGNKVADEIKILRTQILKNMKDVGGNSLLVTSAGSREGKTFIAVNLAVSMAQELDKTVLLVDANLRSPAVHRFFGLDVIRGLSNHLTERVDIPDLLINPGIQKLTILPAGKAIPNSSELLGAPKMEALVKEMKKRYPERFIIFDTSSVLDSADPLVFAKFIDGIVLVVEAEKTQKGDIQRAAEMLKDRPIVGTVLNKARV